MLPRRLLKHLLWIRRRWKGRFGPPDPHTRRTGPVRTSARGRASPLRAFVLIGLALAFDARGATGLTSRENPASRCDHAAQVASRATGVPLAVLRAIALTETGRRRNGTFEPWPWTVNLAGQGLWFGSEAEAVRFARSKAEEGASRFDVGCFQLNYRWHGGAFDTMRAMFDPAANAIYAARFLKSLFDEKGSWSLAAGAYHSRTPTYAERYRARFDRLLAEVMQRGAPPAAGPIRPAPIRPAPDRGTTDTAPPRAERPDMHYPLLQAVGETGLGSLVSPDVVGARALIPALDSQG